MTDTRIHRTYHVIPGLYGDGGFNVVCHDDRAPTWLRILAWFPNEERAKSYAEIEIDCEDGEDGKPWASDVKEPPPTIAPPTDPLPALQYIQEMDRLKIDRLTTTVRELTVTAKQTTTMIEGTPAPAPAAKFIVDAVSKSAESASETEVGEATGAGAPAVATIGVAKTEGQHVTTSERGGGAAISIADEVVPPTPEIPKKKPDNWWPTVGRSLLQIEADARHSMVEAAVALNTTRACINLYAGKFGIKFHSIAAPCSEAVRSDRVAQLRALAPTHTTMQTAKALGLSISYTRKLAGEHDISFNGGRKGPTRIVLTVEPTRKQTPAERQAAIEAQHRSRTPPQASEPGKRTCVNCHEEFAPAQLHETACPKCVARYAGPPKQPTSSRGGGTWT